MIKNYLLIILLSCGLGLVAQVPVIGPIVGPGTSCSEVARTYSTSANNSPLYYQWATVPSTGVLISDPNNSITVISFPYYSGITYTVYCTASNAVGTSMPSMKLVNIYETPTVTFSGSNLSFCQGSSTSLMASATMKSGSSTLSYNWSPSTGLNTTVGPNVIASPNANTTYTLQLTTPNCTNMMMVAVTVKICTGLNYFGNTNEPPLSIYPNPSNGAFFIKGDKNQHIVIYNQLGQTIRRLNIEAGVPAQAEKLPAGTYFIVSGRVTYKVIISP
jgi:hypothetical protein